MVIRVLSESVNINELMGHSILYDPKWEEYLVSGSRKIIAVSERGIRTIYETDDMTNSYYFHALMWNCQDKLLFCIRNKSMLVEIKMK